MVARSWREVNEMHADTLAQGRLDRRTLNGVGRGIRQRRKLVAARVQHLSEIRKMYGYSRQSDVAELMGVSRPRVSKVESGDPSHLELGTIQSYIAALGGKLRVVADFGETTVELSA